MEKKYKHKEIEPKISKMWQEGEYFKVDVAAAKEKNQKPYTIVLPPPNANGKLHVGHALMVAIEDLLIRYKRMQGNAAVWIPGSDHAGFETQVVFERELAKKGKSRLDFDRNTLYKLIWDFVKDQGDTIKTQVLALGPSLDWSRYTFTLDDHVIKTVYKTFEKMANEGLVYRDNYLVNYCTHHNTTLSDLELEHKEQKSPLFYVRYKLVDPAGSEPEYVVVATTRVEPIFVDTHLAVNPKDTKNNWLIGRELLNPLTDKPMKVIGDSFVDAEFGTGIVKLTPAHDKNDYLVAVQQNLPIVAAFGTDGIINETGGALAGLTIADARKKAVEILKNKDLIEKIDEDYQNTVAVCYKCDTVIEPLVLPNWFVKVDSLKKPAHDAVKNGDVKIYPKWQETKYHRWMEEMRDWPISRQIVWGIRIPAWYDVEKNPDIQMVFVNKKGESVNGLVEDLLKTYSLGEIKEGLQTLIAPNTASFTISAESPGENFLQETDTFDTWFSSGHWPLVTLKYPDSEDFNYFYPTNVLETGWEILRFWVSRMIMFGIYLTGKPPFESVYLHGLVRAKDGRKMSKSLGNQVDPLDAVEQYGADALRMGLISGTANGKDFNFPEDRVVAYRNFANKIWNMARFMNIMFEKVEVEVGFFSDLNKSACTQKDNEILQKLSDCISAVDASIEKFRFADGADAIYHFVWDDLASDYIEHVKTREDAEVALCVLRHCFITSLKLLHPFMPFVTEEIWGHLDKNETGPLCLAEWPSL